VGAAIGAFAEHTWFCCCSKKAKVSDWDAVEATPSVSQWDATPGRTTDATPGRWDATPTPSGSRWDATPGRADGATPARKNRWDETPTPGRVSIAACAVTFVAYNDLLRGGAMSGAAAWHAEMRT
jgi:hypothetical protein